ncbi:outer membrane protein assembly factor BamD [Sphingomicrobium astaxanthinifaciens]|uniref:outer membrane protein assembly factor BamD n=1 Tax=Sphingomicrobium astaxanthinifaciens TaxID=1227949 RepID=UPI001FCB8E3F|nr:outer membrane protein assembly factor BamD [Sphingomicrobium astaxanthinifaciens]MCJ7421496.1 outer membrane protein assembly factor BamD [Sphingomicrobium astaxanthinifaciens]
MSIGPTRAALAAALLALPLSACAGGSATEAVDTAYVARDVNTLYALGKQSADRGQWSRAAVVFAEVERQHPYSVWARRAQLMSAFSHYMDRNYPEAVSAAQRFLSIHPGNKDAPYAHYLIAMSYYRQIEDISRDQKITSQARDAFGELIRRYPNSRYAADARIKVDLVNDQLAGKEMEVGRFYQDNRRWLAASIRFRKVIDDYQTTSHAPEALHRLVESYLALGIPAEAQKAAATLGANFPDSKWYERSYRLMQDHRPQG